MRRLTGQLPRAALAASRRTGRIAPQEQISLALTLAPRNQAGLTDLVQRLYTPGDPQYKQFLTPQEFTARFGPTQNEYAAVADFARQQGLTVTNIHPNRLVLDVSGPASVVETALNVRLGRYQSRSGRLFRAPDREPALPTSLAGIVTGIVGLDTANVRQSRLHPALGRADGSGVSGGLSPSDVRTAYTLPSSTGTGQTLALFELDGYNSTDVRTYQSYYGLSSTPLQNILVDGMSGSAGSGSDEVTLDIELATALSPGLSKVLVYETPNSDSGVLDAFNRIANDNLAAQVSTSWGAPESQSSSALLNGENTIFQQMAAQGQSVFSVTGDSGAYDDGATLSVDDPGSQPYVTGVGGTVLATNGAGGTYASETAWGDTTDTTFSPLGSGGGGGFSAVWPVPSYQANLPGHPSGRSVPDVALNSDPNTGYSIYYKGVWHVYGGTSTAAPLWAGFTALVNQQRAAQSLGRVGFLNPLVYQIGASASYTNDFHDITSGDNLYYTAAVGYDNATGWGSFNGAALLTTLVNGLPAPQNATVTGVVTAADTGAPLAGVTISAYSNLGNVLESTTTTGADGSYTLSIPSSLSLNLSVDGYAATGGRYAGAKASVSAADGQTVTKNISLNPAHTFPAGLQMISTPYAYRADTDPLTALFGTASLGGPSGLRFAAWQTDQNIYIFYPASPVNTLSAGLGYWARFPTPQYLHYDGPLVPTTQPFQTVVSVGWNQIGDPFPAAVPLSTVTAAGIPLTASQAISPILYRYDQASNAYVALNAATDSLQPYVGYWIYARSGSLLSMPPP